MYFYVLSLGMKKSSYGLLELVNKPQRTAGPQCDCCGESLTPLRRVPPHRYRIKYGPPGDLLTDRMVTAFSAEFVKAWEASGLCGLEFDGRLELQKKPDLDCRMAWPVCTYTLLDEQASGVVIDDLRGCDKCRVLAIKKIDRIVLQEDTWAGEDIFTSGNLLSLILVSQRFVDFVESNNFTNFDFINQEDYSEDFVF